jgi:hypothetical protein
VDIYSQSKNTLTKQAVLADNSRPYASIFPGVSCRLITKLGAAVCVIRLNL